MKPRVGARYLGHTAWIAALGVSLAGSARADTPPSRWDRARDPRVGEDWDLHVKVRSFLASEENEPRGERRRKYEAALIWLENAHADQSPDVRLRFDLGEVYEDLEHHVRAVEVLEPALASAPDHTAAEDAWISIASAYAHLDRSADEIGAYDACLARTSNISQRATAIGNRAEAHMRLGHLEEAVAGYRDAIALSESMSGIQSLFISDVLARWGLAVALDRSGDEASAVREATTATHFDAGLQIITNRDFVYFVPDYERDYYLALAWTAFARQAASMQASVDLGSLHGLEGSMHGSRSPVVGFWHKAEQSWAEYVREAEAWDGRHKDHPDRWLPLARTHLAKAEKARALAEKRARGG